MSWLTEIERGVGEEGGATPEPKASEPTTRAGRQSTGWLAEIEAGVANPPAAPAVTPSDTAAAPSEYELSAAAKPARAVATRSGEIRVQPGQADGTFEEPTGDGILTALRPKGAGDVARQNKAIDRARNSKYDKDNERNQRMLAADRRQDPAERAQAIALGKANETAAADPWRNLAGYAKTLEPEVRGVMGGLLQAAAEGMKAAGPPELPAGDELATKPTPDAAVLEKMQAMGVDWVQSADDDTKAAMKGLKPGLGMQAVGSAMQSLAMMAPALALGVATGGTGTVLSVMGVETFGQAYGNARKEGLSPQQASVYAALAATVEVGTEYLPVKALLSKNPSFGAWFWNFLAKEVPTELLATAGQSALDKVSVQPEMTAEQFGHDLLITLLSTPLAAGAQAGAVRALRGREPEGMTDERRQEIMSKYLTEQATIRQGMAADRAAAAAPPPAAAPAQPAAPTAPEPPTFVATHTIEGEPVVQAVENGKPVPGWWEDAQGEPIEAVRAEPIKKPVPNAELVIDGVSYPMEVTGRGSVQGTARLTDGQEVPLTQFSNLDDEAMALLGMVEGGKKKAEAPKKAIETPAPQQEKPAQKAIETGEKLPKQVERPANVTSPVPPESDKSAALAGVTKLWENFGGGAAVMAGSSAAVDMDIALERAKKAGATQDEIDVAIAKARPTGPARLSPLPVKKQEVPQESVDPERVEQEAAISRLQDDLRNNVHPVRGDRYSKKERLQLESRIIQIRDIMEGSVEPLKIFGSPGAADRALKALRKEGLDGKLIAHPWKPGKWTILPVERPEPTPEQIALKEKRRKKFLQWNRERRMPNREKDTLIQWLQKSGGIDIAEKLDISGDTKINPRINATQRLFTEKGEKIDEMARKAVENGYLSDAEADDVDGGVQALKDKIRDELGGKPHYSFYRNMEVSEEDALIEEADALEIPNAPQMTVAQLKAAIAAKSKELDAAEELAGDVGFEANVPEDEIAEAPGSEDVNLVIADLLFRLPQDEANAIVSSFASTPAGELIEFLKQRVAEVENAQERNRDAGQDADAERGGEPGKGRVKQDRAEYKVGSAKRGNESADAAERSKRKAEGADKGALGREAGTQVEQPRTTYANKALADDLFKDEVAALRDRVQAIQNRMRPGEKKSVGSMLAILAHGKPTEKELAKFTDITTDLEAQLDERDAAPEPKTADLLQPYTEAELKEREAAAKKAAEDKAKAEAAPKAKKVTVDQSDLFSTQGSLFEPKAKYTVVPKGMVRVYRGETAKKGDVPEWVKQRLIESGSADAQGRWWTTDLEIAKWYATDAPEGRVVFQDVPAEVVEAARVTKAPATVKKFSADPENELFLPPEFVGKGQTIEEAAAKDVVRAAKAELEAGGAGSAYENILAVFRDRDNAQRREFIKALWPEISNLPNQPADQWQADMWIEANKDGETGLARIDFPSISGRVRRFDSGPSTVEYAAAQTDTAPSAAQIEEGNYKKGKFKFDAGPEISIETPAGYSRNPAWPPLVDSYGYVLGSLGFDKEHVDAFIKPGTTTDWNGTVYVVNQLNKENNFDEHKLIFGAASEAEATEIYHRNYEEGWDGWDSTIPLSMEAFKSWAYDPSRKGPKGGPLTQKEARRREKLVTEVAVPAATGSDTQQGSTPTTGDLFAPGTLPGSTARTVNNIHVEAEVQRKVKLPKGRILTAVDAAHAFKELNTWPRERFQMIGVDAKGRPVAFYDLFSGRLTQTSVYPREIWLNLYQTPGVRGVWFAHNHPSGVPDPSRADELLTEQLKEMLKPGMGVTYHGHVIIAGDKFRSIDDYYTGTVAGSDAFRVEPRKTGFVTVPVMERRVKFSSPPGDALTSPQSVRDFIRKLDQKVPGLIMLDAQHRVQGFWPMSLEAMGDMTLNQNVANTMRMIGESNPAAVIGYGADAEQMRAELSMRRVKEFLSRMDVKLLDMFLMDDNKRSVISFAERGLLQDRAPYSIDPLALKIAALEKRVDAAYERGDPKAEDLDAELAKLREDMEEDGTREADDSDGSNLSEQLVDAYRNWLAGGGVYGTREDAIAAMRATIEEDLRWGPSAKPTLDSDILAAAKDAYDIRNERNSRRNGLSLDGSYSIAARGAGIKASAVHAALKGNPVYAAMGDRVTIVQNPLDVPLHVLQQWQEDGVRPTQVRGYYDPLDGRIYLIAANMSRNQVLPTFLHEVVGHYGIDQVLNREDWPAYEKTMLDIYNSRQGDIMAAANSGFMRFYNLDLRNRMHRVIAAQEWIAHKAEKGEEQGLWQKVVAMLRAALRKIGVVRDWSEADLLHLLKLSSSALAHSGEVTYNGAPAFSLIGDLFSKPVQSSAEPLSDIASDPGADFENLNALLGAKLYGEPKDLPAVTVKELFQNSFDGLKELIDNGTKKAGKIDIYIDLATRTITIEDDGGGMSAETLAGPFQRIAGTLKHIERSSGGFGIAKGLFLYGNKHIRVETIRDGILSVLDTTGTILKAAADRRGPAPKIARTRTDRPAGTKITVTIPEDYLDASDRTKRGIYIPLHESGYTVLSRSPLFSNIEVTFNGKTLEGIGTTFKADEISPFSVIKFKWGEATLYVSKAEKKDVPGGNLRYLSNGLWQFSTGIRANPFNWMSEEIPREMYVDIKPAVKPTDVSYPFDLNRQKLSEQTQADFESLLKYIGLIYKSEEAANQSDQFGTARYYDEDGKLSKEIVLKPERDATFEKNLLRVVAGDKIEIMEGKLTVNGREVPTLTRAEMEAVKMDIRQLTIPQEDLDSDSVMLHEGMKFVSDLTFSEAMRVEIGPRYDAMMHGIGRVFRDLRDGIADTYPKGYAALPRARTQLDDYAVGVSIGEDYRGVWVPSPFKGIFINPAAFFSNQEADVSNPLMVANLMFTTMLHEIAHHQYDHGAGHVAEVQKLFATVVSNPDLEILRRQLENIVSFDFEALKHINEAFTDGLKDGSLVPIGNSLEGSKQQIGTSGSAGESPGSVRTGEGSWTGGRAEPANSAAGRLKYDRGLSPEGEARLDGRGRGSYALNEPRATVVYGVREGRVQGMARRAFRGGVWDVFLGNRANETLFARDQFRRAQAGSFAEVQAMFNEAGLELTRSPPQNIQIPDKSLFDQNWVAPQNDSFFKRTIIDFQNRYLLLGQTEKAISDFTGQPIPESTKTEREARLAGSRIAGRVADFKHAYSNRIKEVMVKNRISLKEAGDFRYAQTARERNVAIEEINPENKAGSGMTNEEADKILADVAASPRAAAFQELGQILDEMVAFRENLLLDHRLEDPKAVLLMRDKYKHYAVLKEMKNDEYVNTPVPGGAGFKVGRLINTAMGRFTRAQSEFIIPAMVAQAEGTIAASERAEVTRALLRLVGYAPNEFWSIQQTSSKATIDKDSGMVTRVQMPIEMDRNYDGLVIAVPMGEKRLHIVVKDLEFAQQFLTSGYDVPKMAEGIGVLTRFIALTATAANPAFTPVNYVKDTTQAILRALGTYGPKVPAQMVGDTLSAFWYSGPVWAAYHGLRIEGQITPEHSKWLQVYKNYIEDGGYVTFRGAAGAETQLKEFTTQLAEAGIYPSERTWWDGFKMRSHRAGRLTGAKQTWQWIMDVNGAIEQATRLSLYKNLVQDGVNRKDAALAARDITVDFDLKGEATRQWGTIFAFLNPNIQGNAILLKNFKQMPKAFGAIALALMMFGYAMDDWNRRHSKEDPHTGRNIYDSMNDNIKANNFILMGPEGDDAILAPLPYGFNIFFNAGVNIGAAVKGKKSPLVAAKNMMIGAFNAMSPLGNWPKDALDLIQFFGPSALDPFVQQATNRTWNAAKMSPERPDMFNRTSPQPNAETFWPQTPKPYIEAARWMNQKSGGNEVRSGWADFRPNHIQHAVESIAGGAGKTYAQLGVLAYNKITGQETDPKENPFLRRFYMVPKDTELAKLYYENLQEVATAKAEVKSAEKLNDRSSVQERLRVHQDELYLVEAAHEAESRIGALRKESAAIKIRANWTEEQKKLALEKTTNQMHEAMAKFIRTFEQKVSGAK